MSQERRFQNMVAKFGNAKTLFDYQKLRAIYTDRKESNYVEAMRQSRPILYQRLENRVARLPDELFNRGANVLYTVTKNSSPKELFNAINKVSKMRVKPIVPVTKVPLNKVKYNQSYMAQELGKSRNRKNYAGKVALFSDQADYARAVVRAKVLLAKRVKERYERLSEANKKFVNISGINKSSSPQQLLRALERMALFNNTNNGSWRFI